MLVTERVFTHFQGPTYWDEGSKESTTSSGKNHPKFTLESHFSRLKKDGRRGFDDGCRVASRLGPTKGGVEVLKVILVAIPRVDHHHRLSVHKDRFVICCHALECKTLLKSWSWRRSWIHSGKLLALLTLLDIAKLLAQASQSTLDGAKKREWGRVDRFHHQSVVELRLILRQVLKVIDRLEIVQKLVSVCSRKTRKRPKTWGWR